MRIIKRIITALLVAAIFAASYSVFFVLSGQTAKANDKEDKISLPEYIPEDSEKRSEHTKHLSEYDTEYVTIYENEDGSKTVYSFANPIRYKDANGKLVDYDSTLKKDSNENGYAYTNKSSNANILLPNDIVTDKGVIFDYDKYKITFKPDTDLSKDTDEDFVLDDKYKYKEIKDSGKVVGVKYTGDDLVSYEYISTDAGIKQEIIFEEAPESNTINFVFTLENLKPNLREDQVIEFVDSQSDKVISTMDKFCYVEDYSKNIKLNIIKSEAAENEYILEMVLDEEFLHSENTVYPITIDTALALNAGTKFSSTYVSSAYPAYNYSAYLPNILGYSSTLGTIRTYTEFNMLNSSEFSPNDISSAIYKSAEAVRNTNVEIFRVTEEWNSGELTWNNKPAYDGELEFPSASQGSASFDITDLVLNWVKYDFSQGVEGYPNYGFVIKDIDNAARFGSEDNSVVIIEYENIDRQAPDNISQLSITKENIDNDGGAEKIIVGWNEAVDNPLNYASGIQKYELALYKSDGSLVGSVIEIPRQNNPQISGVTYPGENWDYEYEFTNITDEETYYCTIRACDNAVDTEGNPKYNWTECIQSESFKLSDLTPISLAIDTAGWTNDTTPKITWSGVKVRVEGTVDIQYQLNGGEWMDSGWTGASGSGTFDSSTFTDDGEYKIKIRGKVDIINSETGETETFAGEESQTVVYKRDACIPVVTISSPKSAAEFGNSLRIKGSISDGGSGINSWILEYESNVNPGVWKTIAYGDKELSKNSTLVNWDTSALAKGFYTIRLQAFDNDGKNSDVKYSVTVEKVNNAEPITPTNVKATLIEDTNISAKISWEDTQNSQDIVYNVYRSSDADFTTSTLVAADVYETYWIDKDIFYGQEYYYSVSSKIQEQESVKTTDFAQIKLAKMLGLQDFWKYSNFETNCGNGYINVANGNLVYNTADFVCSDELFAIVMQRIYNSESSVMSSIGYGWDFYYNTCLYQEKDDLNNLLGMILIDGDGSRHYFAYDSSTGTYITPNGIFIELTYNTITGEHVVTGKDGISYIFRDDLKLTKISDNADNCITFEYDLEDKLITLENSVGDTIEFAYYQQSDINSPFYTDDSVHIGLLAQITSPDGTNTLYTYKEDAAVLAAISTSLEETVIKEIYSYVNDTYQLAEIVDIDNNYVLISYTEIESKVLKIIFSDEEYCEFSYKSGITTQINNSEDFIEYDYNEQGCITRIKNPVGDETTYKYNNNLQVIELSYNYLDGDSKTISYYFIYDQNTGELLYVTDASRKIR